MATALSLNAPIPILISGTIAAGLLLVHTACSALRRPHPARTAWISIWVAASATAALGFCFRGSYYLWTFANALALWLCAFAVWVGGRDLKDEFRRQRQVLFGAIALSGVAVWIATAHLTNRPREFYSGLLIGLALLILVKRWRVLPGWGIQVANTLILLIVMLPLASFWISPTEEWDAPPPLSGRPYSHAVARTHPSQFARWSRHNREQNLQLFLNTFDQKKRLLIPNATTRFWDCTISINSDGYRGSEIPREKGNAYRIVALGESTTFGMTLEKNGRPWPEILQNLIQQRLKPARPVQVINAGIPGINLEENLRRLRVEIMRLKPDMILSYHGFNGFRFIYNNMPPIHGKPPPAFRPRPLTILANFEHRLAVLRYRKEYDPKVPPRPAFISNPTETKYARLYEQLIAFARTNNIPLAIGTYSMAVNEQSPKDVIDFHRLTYPSVDWYIRANAAHSAMVRQLAREHPDVDLVDTCPALDGRYEAYQDLMHFTEEGRETMAELYFAGIRETLEHELGTMPSEDSDRAASE